MIKNLFFPFEQLIKLSNHLFSGIRVLGLYLIIALILIYVFCIYFDLKYSIALSILTTILSYILFNRVFQHSKNSRQNLSIPIIVTILLLIVGLTYRLITDYYDRELNIANYFDSEVFHPNKSNDTYNIYAGERSGLYYQIADLIQKDDPLFRVITPPPVGGTETPNMILQDPKGIGFVQEDILSSDPTIKAQLNLIAPLYMEKLHILYNTQSPAFRSLSDNKYRSYGQLFYCELYKMDHIINNGTLVYNAPTISRQKKTINRSNSSILLKAFNSAQMATGVVGSATKIASSVYLNAIGFDITHMERKNIHNVPLDSAIQGIRRGKYDVIFFMAGQPVTAIQRILFDFNNFDLLNIDPALIDKINLIHHSNYRIANFNVRNENGIFPDKTHDITTVGSYAYLISNSNLPPFIIKKFVNHLNNIATRNSLHVDFFNFKEYFDLNYYKKRGLTLASFLLAFMAGITLGILLLSFSLMLFSTYYYDKYSAIITNSRLKIPDESIPDLDQYGTLRAKDEATLKDFTSKDEINFPSTKEINIKHQMDDYYNLNGYGMPKTNNFSFNNPFIMFNQIPLINRIVTNISELIKLRNVVSESYNKGKLNTSHFNVLHQHMDQVINKYRKSLFLRINELAKREKEQLSLDINNEAISNVIQNYLTSGYLKLEHFDYLYHKYNTRDTSL